MECKMCKGETRDKQITSKKDGKVYTLKECVGDCKNDKGYRFSFFPPKGQAAPAVESPLLKEILTKVTNIENMLANPKGIQIATDELKPDDKIEF